MSSNNYIDILIPKVKTLLKESRRQSPSHRWDHLNRVMKTAVKIARYETGVDVEVLKVAALLHDIDQPYDDKEKHVKRSLSQAQKILEEIHYPQEKMKLVLEAISTHSTEDLKRHGSVEGRILFDADKIDGLGVVGIIRVFILCGKLGMTIEEAIKWYENKIKVSEENLQTSTGRRLWRRRLPYVKSFLRRYHRETSYS